MKVMKFGGTSVGSIESILKLKGIVEAEAAHGPVVVVVSALGGITDKLLATARMAVEANGRYRDELNSMVLRHHAMVDAVIPEGKRLALLADIDALFQQLKSIYFGVELIRDLSEKTLDAIVSYGELLSSRIVGTLIEGAAWLDSRQLITTETKQGKRVLDTEATYAALQEQLAALPRVTVMGGFISRDKKTGETTNLGRGGSDYTAAIVAAALDAETLEIWTDVNGFMTADPRVIPGAYTIPELSYLEATELCNFGAKVIYPPTIYPVCVKNIPIKVKNTFNPDNPGTVIRAKAEGDPRAIKGISSIGGIALITVTGLSMVGVIGVNRRIFTALADNGISVFLVCQASSENSTSIGVQDGDAAEAERVLNEEFAKEIGTGAMYPMRVQHGLAAIAIVGENMRSTPGIAGRLFGTLGRSGISVIACAQGANGTNLSVVIGSEHLRKALNAIHDSFFLSEYTVLNLFVCGVGVVGGKLLEQIRAQREQLLSQRRLMLRVAGIANSRKALLDAGGIDLDTYREQLAAQPDSPQGSARAIADAIVDYNLYNSVFIDCTASQDVADMYLRLLEHSVSIVAANKIAASSSYPNYRKLKDTAMAHGVKFRFETNVGAGLPIIGTINDLCNCGDNILRIEAVLSGTFNYIFNELSPSVPFSQAVRKAHDEGYTEPDPRVDLGGTDVVRKIVILTREAGYPIDAADVEFDPVVPAELLQGSVDDFWAALPSVDEDFERRRQEVEASGKRWRLVASMQSGKARVSLQAVDESHPFYRLEGSNNIVLLTTDRYREYPMQIKGYGAGANVTAAGVFANTLSIANL